MGALSHAIHCISFMNDRSPMVQHLQGLLSVPLPTIQSETWLVRAKVREPHLSPPVRMNFLPLALVLKGKARKVHTNRGVQMWFANFRVNQPCFRLDPVGRGTDLWHLLSEQLPCRSAEVKFFSVFLCQRCREIWREILVKFSGATFSRVWVCDGKFHQNFTSKTVWKTENFTQISLCWRAALTNLVRIGPDPLLPQIARQSVGGASLNLWRTSTLRT